MNHLPSERPRVSIFVNFNANDAAKVDGAINSLISIVLTQDGLSKYRNFAN